MSETDYRIATEREMLLRALADAKRFLEKLQAQAQVAYSYDTQVDIREQTQEVKACRKEIKEAQAGDLAARQPYTDITPQDLPTANRYWRQAGPAAIQAEYIRLQRRLALERRRLHRIQRQQTRRPVHHTDTTCDRQATIVRFLETATEKTINEDLIPALQMLAFRD